MADEGKKVRERVDAKTAFAGYLHLMRSATEGFGDNPFPSDEHDREPENATLEERVMVILGCVADVLACRRPHSRRALDLGVAFYLDEPLLLLLLRLGAVLTPRVWRTPTAWTTSTRSVGRPCSPELRR